MTSQTVIVSLGIGWALGWYSRGFYIRVLVKEMRRIKKALRGGLR